MTRLRGHCPSVHQPMRARDGLLARIRVPTGELDAAALRLISAEALTAECRVIELTNRANLQLRGLDDAGAERLRDRLVAVGLAHADPAAEAVRCVVCHPMAGLDATELADLRPLALILDDMLTSVPAFRLLPPKLGIRLEGSGRFALDARARDLALVAEATEGGTVLRLGLGDVPTPLCCSIDRAPDVVSAVLRLYLALIAGLSEAPSIGALAMELSRRMPRDEVGTFPLRESPLPTVLRPGWYGQDRPGCSTLAALVPAGRMTPATLIGLADLAERFGGGTVRLTPWRLILVPDIRDATIPSVEAMLASLGLSRNAADPWGGLVPCIGSRGCAEAATDTLADAGRLAMRLEEKGLDPPLAIDVSGCVKGCARRRAADAALIGTGAGSGCYTLLIGDRFVADLPASAAVDALAHLARRYAAGRLDPTEGFAEFWTRQGEYEGEHA